MKPAKCFHCWLEAGVRLIVKNQKLRLYWNQFITVGCVCVCLCVHSGLTFLEVGTYSDV